MARYKFYIVLYCIIYSNSHLRMCGYSVSVGKVRIISASTSAVYHFEHPQIRTSAFWDPDRRETEKREMEEKETERRETEKWETEMQ